MTRILISGGGTGGHIAPAIAVAEALGSIAPGVEVFFVSTPRPVDRRMYAPFGSRVRVLDPPRKDGGPAARLLLPFGALSAFIRARRVVKEIGPRAILSTGGYASFFCEPHWASPSSCTSRTASPGGPTVWPPVSHAACSWDSSVRPGGSGGRPSTRGTP
jgi:hypothetical protein